MKVLAVVLAASFLHTAMADVTFKKVQLRTTFQGVEQGSRGRLVVGREGIRFMGKRGATFQLPAEAPNDLFYSRVSGRRIKAALIPAVVFPPTLALLATKGRKHYMTVSFHDGADSIGAVEFKLHKSNYRSVLRASEQVTGLTMGYDQEGIKDSKQDIARRTGAPSGELGVLSIVSDPEGAEIEIDGAYVGDSPRSRALKPGTYTIRLKKNGTHDWKRKVNVAAGETLELRPQMDAK